MDNQAQDSLGLLTIGEDRKIPDKRIANVLAARAVFDQVVEDDRKSSENRAKVHQILMGRPPLDTNKLVSDGLTHVTNINDGTAKRVLDEMVGNLMDVLFNTTNTISVRTGIGNANDELKWSRQLSHIISKVVTRWDDFTPLVEALAQHFIWEGVGIAFWDDSKNWMFDVGGLRDFYFPRQTRPKEAAVEVMFARRDMRISELYRKVYDKETAEAVGWNVDNCINACIAAGQKSCTTRTFSLEDLNTLIKCNDVTYTKLDRQIAVVHAFVNEFDGTVSHLIFTEEAIQNNDEINGGWLFSAPGKYNSMDEAICFFTYGVGTENQLHSIRGMGYELFPLLVKKSRLFSASIDAAELNASIIIKPASNLDNMAAAVQPAGPYLFLHPDSEIVEQPNLDLSKATLPGISLIDSFINERAGKYSPLAGLQTGEKSRAEIEAMIQQTSKLSSSASRQWYRCLDKLFRGIVNRMVLNYRYSVGEDGNEYELTDEDRLYIDGGKEVNRILVYLDKQNIPRESFWNIDLDETKAVRPVGGDSPKSRQQALMSILPLRGSMDTNQQRILDREIVESYTNPEMAQLLIIPDDTSDPENAKMHIILDENDAMVKQDGSGIDKAVLDTDDHKAHMEQHLQLAESVYQQQQQHQISNAQAYLLINKLVEHMSKHIELAAQTEYNQEMANAWRQQVQNYGEVMNNGLKELQKQQETEQQNANDDDRISKEEKLAQIEIAKAQKLSEVKIKEQQAAARIEADRQIMKAARERSANAAAATNDLLGSF